MAGIQKSANDEKIAILKQKLEAAKKDAAQRISDGKIASNGGGSAPLSPLDFVRSSDSYSNAIEKLGGSKLLYGNTVNSLLYADELNAGTRIGNTIFSESETTALTQLLELSGAIGLGETYTSDNEVLIIAPGESISNLRSLLSDSYGGLVTSNDLDNLLGGLDVVDGIVSAGDALNTTGLRNTVIERFTELNYSDSRVADSYASYINAPDGQVYDRPSAGSRKLQLRENYLSVVSSVRGELVDSGYLPSRIAYSEKVTSIYKGIELALDLGIPGPPVLGIAKRLGAFARKFISNPVTSRVSSLVDIEAGFAGRILRTIIPGRFSKQIDRSLRGLDEFGNTVHRSQLAGVQLEGTVGKALDEAGLLLDYQSKIRKGFTANGKPIGVGEIDAETKRFIIEVASSKNPGKDNQLKGLVNNTLLNPERKPVILFAPRVTSPQQLRHFQNNIGVTVINDIEQLLKTITLNGG